MMPKCRILDDRYGEKIYQEIRYILSEREFPVKTNILSPMGYLKHISPGDIIILDNYFPLGCCEGALGELFLEQYIEQEMENPIIAISSYGKRLLDTSKIRKTLYEQGKILAWIPEKDGFEIGAIIQAYLQQQIKK